MMQENIGKEVKLDNSSFGKLLRANAKHNSIVVVQMDENSFTIEVPDKRKSFTSSEGTIKSNVDNNPPERRNTENLAWMLANRSPQVTRVVCPGLLEYVDRRLEQAWSDVVKKQRASRPRSAARSEL